LRIYINRVLSNEAHASGNPWASTKQVYIAADPGCGNRYQWVGIIDEIAVFNVTLGDNDIKALTRGYEGASNVSTMRKLATIWGELKAD
jgi:hypothetical protein